jgi:hypothetical protein
MRTSQPDACRVIAQAICAGYQERKVCGYTGQMASSGQPYIAVRVGRVLIYLEDREALTSFIQAFDRAQDLVDRVFPLSEEFATTERPRQPPQKRTR